MIDTHNTTHMCYGIARSLYILFSTVERGCQGKKHAEKKKAMSLLSKIKLKK